jgi:hypothetical protein
MILIHHMNGGEKMQFDHVFSWKRHWPELISPSPRPLPIQERAMNTLSMENYPADPILRIVQE